MQVPAVDLCTEIRSKAAAFVGQLATPRYPVVALVYPKPPGKMFFEFVWRSYGRPF